MLKGQRQEMGNPQGYPMAEFYQMISVSVSTQPNEPNVPGLAIAQIEISLLCVKYVLCFLCRDPFIEYFLSS